MTDEYRVDRLLNGDLSALTTLASSTSTLKSDGAYHQQRGLKPPRVPLVFFEDCGREIVKPSLIKGVFATGETSTWIGPPGSGKSALLATAHISIAAGRDWYGFGIKKNCGGIYFALERGILVERRLKAHRLRDGLDEKLPIAIKKQIVDLMNPKCVEEFFLPAIRAAEDRWGTGVGFITIDTYNKGIAYGGGDEDKARDQNRVLANLRHLHDLHDLHIALVGHTGKDPSRGARGSNALPGDSDMENQFSLQGDLKIVATTKANDAPEGELLRFKLEPYQVGADDDGTPVNIWIATNEVIETQAAAAPQRKNKPKLTAVQQNALTALIEAAANGTSAPASTGLPLGCLVTTMTDWKNELLRRGVIAADHSNPRQSIKHLKEALQAKKLLAIDGETVWPVL
jgi:hypothetical protein